jgi:methylthioribose-1-phosphate isomerase
VIKRSVKQSVEALRWKDGRLEMLNQRVLPTRFEYLTFNSAIEVAEGIRSMVVRGAPIIGCTSAYGVALEAQRLRSTTPREFASAMDKAFKVLAESRPTAMNLFWALKRMRALWKDTAWRTSGEIADVLLRAAHEMLAENFRINRSMGAFGATLLSNDMRIFTHCNAGALATAGHGTALGIIRSAVEVGKQISVIVGETRPFLQGARLTVWEMVQEKIPVTLITDNMTGYLMSRGEIDAVVVGADRVAANGDVANKIGTYMVAVLAKRHSIPFYVACPLSTIDLATPNGAAIPIEERNADEVTSFHEYQWVAKEVNVCNPAFDVTPADLVTALVTEKGIVEQPNSDRITKLFKR